MLSILTLAVMVLLVATMRTRGGAAPFRRAKQPPTRASRPASGKKGDKLIVGRGVKLGPPEPDPDNPGVVSYRLLDDHKLPSPARRAWRRVTRPFAWFNRRFSSPKPDSLPAANPRTVAESVELQNFLDARNRELGRRKGQDPSSRGPEDTLH